MNAILTNKEALGLRSMLSTLYHVRLHDLPGFHLFCFTWLEAVLDSNYSDADKDELSGLILMILRDKSERMWSGDWREQEFPPLYATVLARFLHLHEDIKPGDRAWEFSFPTVTFDARPTTIALRLLVGLTKDGLTIPVFLVLTPALQRDRWRRVLALKLLNRHRNWLFSPMIEDLLPTHRTELLGAIGDPFDPTTVSHLVRPDGPQVHDPRDAYLPSKVMGLLLALASSDMWRDHLHPMNFASCDAIMAEEQYMYHTITYFSSWGSLLKGPGDSNFSGLMLGVNRLKQLRCHSAVKLILLSLWSTPITPLYDKETWRWVERQTLELFSARGETHLGTFVSQIKEMYGEAMINFMAKLEHPEGKNDLPDIGPPFRVGEAGRRVRTKDPEDVGQWNPECNFYATCQLRRLYRLIGHDPTGAPAAGAAWEGTVDPPRPEPDGSEQDVDQAPE